VHPRPAYLDDIVVDAVHAWMPMADQKGVRITLRALDEAPASLDPVYVERLIGILLDNAIRYTQPDGEIDVSVTMANATAQLTVADTGIGIGVDERARVFERFFRGAGARAMSPEGSGLGLPIARWIAQAHRATLELVPRAGGGTIATVTFAPTSLLPIRVTEGTAGS
jgi:signal transduction histidine kinase